MGQRQPASPSHGNCFYFQSADRSGVLVVPFVIFLSLSCEHKSFVPSQHWQPWIIFPLSHPPPATRLADIFLSKYNRKIKIPALLNWHSYNRKLVWGLNDWHDHPTTPSLSSSSSWHSYSPSPTLEHDVMVPSWRLWGLRGSSTIQTFLSSDWSTELNTVLLLVAWDTRRGGFMKWALS